jgi:hypothetical protein
MKKKKLLLVVAGVVVAALILLAGFLLFRGIAKLKATQDRLERAELDLRGDYAKEPFPSTQNVERVRANVGTLDAWQKKLSEKLSVGQVMPDTTRSPSAFISLLEQTRRELLGIGGEAVDESFAFGFDRYFAEGSVRPVPAHVPRLTQQLLIISDVCKVLFDADVITLTGIQREQFEGGTRVVADPEAGLLQEGTLFTPLRFQFVFVTKEAALLNLLNRLARHTMFISVSEMNIDRTDPDVVIPAEEEEDGNEFIEEEPVEDTGEAEKPVVLSLEERTVSGPRKQQPVTVTLELDVYRFLQAEQGQEQE